MSDTSEESGPPVTTETEPRPALTPTPPPLSAEQVEKVVKFAEAAKEMIDALGSLYVDYCRWWLRNSPPMLIPPLIPPAIVPESTSPPETTL